jgi:TetR/AcrR family transcriptional repressor of mexJK operon
MMSARPVTRPRGRPTADAAQARDEDILAAAGALFEAHGFAGVTMAAVARRARISKTTLYARYPDKGALFRAICSYACRVPAGRIAAVAVEGRAVADVLADFATAMQEATADPAADRFLRLAIFEAPRFPALADQILAESRAVSAPLADWLASLERRGQLPDHDPSTLAAQFVALVTGGHDGLLARGEGAQVRAAAAIALVLPAITGA